MGKSLFCENSKFCFLVHNEWHSVGIIVIQLLGAKEKWDGRGGVETARFRRPYKSQLFIKLECFVIV